MDSGFSNMDAIEAIGSVKPRLGEIRLVFDGVSLSSIHLCILEVL